MMALGRTNIIIIVALLVKISHAKGAGGGFGAPSFGHGIGPGGPGGLGEAGALGGPGGAGRSGEPTGVAGAGGLGGAHGGIDGIGGQGYLGPPAGLGGGVYNQGPSSSIGIGKQDLKTERARRKMEKKQSLELKKQQRQMRKQRREQRKLQRKTSERTKEVINDKHKQALQMEEQTLWEAGVRR
ncbi:hypothetical protein MTO96_047123 [Rhipicephalus appendiculatus]